MLRQPLEGRLLRIVNIHPNPNASIRQIVLVVCIEYVCQCRETSCQSFREKFHRPHSRVCLAYMVRRRRTVRLEPSDSIGAVNQTYRSPFGFAQRSTFPVVTSLLSQPLSCREQSFPSLAAKSSRAKASSGSVDVVVFLLVACEVIVGDERKVPSAYAALVWLWPPRSHKSRSQFLILCGPGSYSSCRQQGP